MKRQPALPRSQGGYILALNIAVLAMMLVGATYIGERMTLALKLAQAEQRRVADELALEDARARVLFLLSTVPRTRDGLGSGEHAVRLDGRYYRAGEGALVSLQDARGLFGINVFGLIGSGRDRIERFLATYGLAPPDIARLTDTLLDYRDGDNLRRISGAEAEDYLAAGKGDTPRNANLLAPNELGRVLGWGEQEALWQEDPVSEEVHTYPRGTFNPNTAGWRALAAQGSLTPEIAQSLVRSRRSGEIPDISRLAFSGAIGDPFGAAALVSPFPGETVIVTLRPAGANWGYRLAVEHTPIGAKSPWRIQYAYRVALAPLDDKEAAALAGLPLAGALRDFAVKEQLQLPF